MNDDEPMETLAEALNKQYAESDLGKALAENQALRDERDRLREALVKCRRELWHCNEQLKYKGATEGFSVTEALSEAKAALTPAGQRLTPNEATE